MWYRKQEIIKMDKQIERAGDDNKNNIGVLYGIGVGPGDPGLMTLKAINTIKACDIIAIPAVSKEECYAYSIVQAVLPEIEKKHIMCTPFPMIKDKEKLTISHNKIYCDIVMCLKMGKMWQCLQSAIQACIRHICISISVSCRQVLRQ